eukprot:353161-Chlamydomonas_euryale.AAC.4
MLGDRQLIAADKIPACTDFLGGRCLECPRRPELAHQPGQMVLASLGDACSNKRWAMGHGSPPLQQTVVVEKSELGEGRAGAASMFGRIGIKITAMTCAMGDRRLAIEGDRVRTTATHIAGFLRNYWDRTDGTGLHPMEFAWTCPMQFGGISRIPGLRRL